MTNALEPSEFVISSKSSPLNEILLADIWRAFAIYDRSANNAQKRFISLRLWLLRLSIFVTCLAVINTRFPNLFTINTTFFIKLIPTFPKEIDLIQILVIIAPISVSILLAGTIKFGRGVNWILLRASAEIIRQEIYRYRTQVGDYNDPVIKDVKFAQAVQNINERLMKTQVNQSGLDWHQIQMTDRKSLLGTIHNAIGSKDTNPLGVLAAEQYVDYRLIDQLAWYRKKTLDLDQKWQQWQWLIYILGGIGTFLAAIGWDIWITISNAVASSVLSFLEFRRLDSTLIGYNQTATNLENILFWWHALTDSEKNDPKNIEKLVESSEKVIRSETTGWVQEMKDAMADLYKLDEEDSSKKSEKEDDQIPEKIENKTNLSRESVQADESDENDGQDSAQGNLTNETINPVLESSETPTDDINEKPDQEISE